MLRVKANKPPAQEVKKLRVFLYNLRLHLKGWEIWQKDILF